MEVPIEASFPDTDKPAGADELIAEQVERLEEVCDHIISCRLIAEQPHKHPEGGHPFRIRLTLRVPPQHEIVVSNNPNVEDMHDPFHIALKKVFDKARRQLYDLVEKQRGEVKRHPEQERVGIVAKLFPDEGYGFLLEADTNREIYFHGNAVLHDEFGELEVGTAVRYVTETGRKGEQASTVEIVEQPRRV